MTGCISLSTVYEQTVPRETDAETKRAIAPVVAKSSEPTLRPPRLLRVWIAPWQDGDGDLHDQQHLYLVLEPAAWSIGLPEPVFKEPGER